MYKFENKYRLRSAECDKFNQMRLRSLFNLFQDMADLHAEKFGFGYSFCLQNQMTWVGTGYHLVINRLPQRDEEFVLETWHAGSYLMTARRDFELKDLEGNVLVAAYSNWALIDLNKKRPVIVQKYLSDETLIKKKAIDAEFKKVVLPQELDNAVLLQVRKDDIDINQHVNNAVYPAWILDGLDDDFLNTHQLKELKIQFKTGALLENEVAIFSKIEDTLTYHLISSPTKEIEFALVEACWKTV